MALEMERLFLVDANSYVYRGYYSFSGMTDSKGRPVDAIYGFAHFLLKLLKDQRPDYIAVVFEPPTPAIRHKKAFDFEAKRPMMPPDLKLQLSSIKDIVRALRIPIYQSQRYESNDILGSIAKKALGFPVHTFIVSSDKDTLQLVSHKLSVLNPNQNDLIYDLKMVKEKFQVSPALVPHLLALMGDKSDNIPGVPGIGRKKAVELINKFGSAEAVLENMEGLMRKNAKAISAPELQKETKKMAQMNQSVFLGKRIATIDKGVPLKFDLERCKAPKRFDLTRLSQILREFELVELLSQLLPHKRPALVEYKKVISKQDLNLLLEDLARVTEFAIDTETTGVRPMLAELVGISIATRPGQAYYIPVGHSYVGAVRQLEKDFVLSKLRPILEDPSKKKVGQNIKYDIIILKNSGIDLAGIYFDTMIASYLLNPGGGHHNLDDMALKFLNYKTIFFKELFDPGAKQPNIAQVDIEKVTEYACEDADVTLQLKLYLEPFLKEKGLMELFQEVEMPLVEVLVDMEMHGATIDRDYLLRLSKQISERVEALAEDIYKLAGEEFNINSHKQLGEVLFEKLKIPVHKRTKTGYSTTDKVLEKLSPRHPIAAKIIEYRSLSNIKAAHLEPLLDLINPKTGRVHTSFNQTVAATGRLTSSRPNLQNVPIRSEFGGRIRGAFVAEKGFLLSSGDYSQVELRILAHLTKDPNLIEDFENSRDVHTLTASRLFGIPPEEVSGQMRDKAKVVNFGIIYGMTAQGLAAELKISQDEAARYIQTYFAKHPRIKDFILQTIRQARRDGYVTTILNRRRYLPQINSKKRIVRELAQREAINTPIQGSAADIIKIAMIKLNRLLKEKGLASRMLLQIHDELVLEVAERELQQVLGLLKDSMENAVRLSVPIKVNIATGPNWLHLRTHLRTRIGSDEPASEVRRK